jgi:hypothetical protein
MKISGEYRKNLRSLLQGVFKTLNELKRIADEDLEKNLEEINGDNLENKIYNLIIWAQENDKLKKLIEVALEKNPCNQELKDIQENLFPNIVDKPINPASEYWNSLCDILDEIDLKILEKVCRITLENNPKNQDIDGNYPELKNLQELATLKEILLEKYPKNQLNNPTIIEFAQRLTKENITTIIHNRLSEWIEDVAKELNYKTPFYQDKDKPKLSTIAQSYLMIKTEPKGDDKFYLEAELIIDFNPSIDKQKPTKIGTPQKLVLPCRWDDMAQNIYEYVLASQQNITAEYKKYVLTVELFLPIQYLHRNIDAQEITNTLNKKEAISKNHRFILRSLDRFNSGDYRYINKLYGRWKKVNNYYTIISNFDEYNSWDELADKWEDEETILVNFTCCLPEDREELFIAIIESGLPISLWTRYNFPDLKEEYQDILSRIDKKNFESSLIELVWKKRKKAHVKKDGERENHLGYHLGFLCDNPHRIPICLQDNNQPLIETGN